MIRKIVIYLVIASTFKRNECSPAKEQEINSTESIERDNEEPIWPLSKERQEKNDRSVEIKTYSTQKGEEIERDDKSVKIKTKSTQKEEKKTKSSEIKTYLKEKEGKQDKSSEIKTNFKEFNDKVTKHTISQQKEVRIQEAEDGNVLRVAENKTKRADVSEESEKLLQSLSEVVNYNTTSVLPFPLVTMDGESHKKTAELIRMVQNADLVSRGEKLLKSHPVKDSQVNPNLGSYDDKTRDFTALRRVNLVNYKLRHVDVDSPDNPKDERRYIISNFDVVESYINSRRSPIDPLLSRKSIAVADDSEGSDSSEWASNSSNDEEIQRAKENETETRQGNLNYNDKSVDYIVTTKRNVWDYEHEDWAAETQKVSWSNVHSSGEKETANSDQRSLERKEPIAREQEETKEKEHEYNSRKKKHKKEEDETISLNRKNLTNSYTKDINTLNVLKNRELDTSVQNSNQHTKDDDDSKKKRLGEKRNVEKINISDDDETPYNTNKQSKGHQNQDQKEIQTKMDVVNNRDQSDIKHRGGRSNKITSLQNFGEIEENLTQQMNRKKLAKMMDEEADKRNRKQKNTSARLKKPDISKNIMEPNRPDISNRQERQKKQRETQEESERSLKQQKNYRSDKDDYDTDDNPVYSRFTKRTTDYITDGVKTKKRGRKDRAYEDYKDSYDYRSNKKDNNKKDYSDYNNPKNTHQDYDRANNERADQGQNIERLGERNDRKKEESKFSDNDRIDMDNDKFQSKNFKSSHIDHENTREEDKIDSREAKPSKNRLITNKFSEESININRNKNVDWKDSREAQPTKNKIVKDEISGKALKNKTNTHEPWDRHANNNWDQVGVGKKEDIRTTKSYNDYDDLGPKRTSKDYHDDSGPKRSSSKDYYDDIKSKRSTSKDYNDDIEPKRSTSKDYHDDIKSKPTSRDYHDDIESKRSTSKDYHDNIESKRSTSKDYHDDIKSKPISRDYHDDIEPKRSTNKDYHDDIKSKPTSRDYHDNFKPKRPSKDEYDEITTKKNKVETWNKHQNNDWGSVGVDRNAKTVLRSGKGHENRGGLHVRTALPFRERKSVYDSDANKK